MAKTPNPVPPPEPVKNVVNGDVLGPNVQKGGK